MVWHMGDENAVGSGTPPVPKLGFTMREAANSLGCSYASVQRLVSRGQLKSSDALRTKIIPRTEIERFLRVR